MASYVESATLRVIDQSSAPLGRIDAALKRLHATARSMASTRVNIDTSGANRGLETLQNQMRQLSRGAVTTSVNVNTTAARRAVDSLTSHMRGLGLGGRGNASTLAIGANMAGINQVRAGLAAIANSVRRINTTPLHVPAAPGQVGGVPRVPTAPSPAPAGGYPTTLAEWRARRDHAALLDRIAHWTLDAQRRRQYLNAGQAGHNIIRSGGRGITDANTAREAMLLRGLPQDAQDIITSSATAASERYRTVSRAQLIDIGLNTYANLGNKADLPRVMDMMAMGIQAIQANMGGDPVAAARAVAGFTRALDTSGRFDSYDAVAPYLDMILRSQIVGRDVSPQLIASGIRRIGVGRFALNPEAFGDFVTAVDESQGDAGNQYRTMIRELTARVSISNRTRTRMERAGLRRIGGGATNEALLSQNPFDWSESVVVPLLRRAGIDLNDRPAVQAWLANAGFQQSGIRLASSLIFKRDEIIRDRAARKLVNLNPEFIQGMPSRAIKSTGTAIKSQFQNAADALTLPAQPVISGGGDLLARYLGWLSQIPPSGAASILTGGLLAGGQWAASHVYNNPGTLLNIAGLKLTSAAFDLSKAAAALTVASGKPGVGTNIVAPVVPAGGSVPNTGTGTGPAPNPAANRGIADYARQNLGGVATTGTAALGGIALYWQRVKSGIAAGWGWITSPIRAGASWLGGTMIGRAVSAVASPLAWAGRGIASIVFSRWFAAFDIGLMLATGGRYPGLFGGALNWISGLFTGSAHAATPGGPPARPVEPLTLLERAQQRLDELAAGRRPYDPPPGDQGGGGAFLGGVQGAAPTLIDTAAAQMLQSGQMVVQGASMFEVAAMSIADAGPVLQSGIEAGAAAGAEMFAARIAEAAAAININVAAPAAGANTGANPGIAR